MSSATDANVLAGKARRDDQQDRKEESQYLLLLKEEFEGNLNIKTVIHRCTPYLVVVD